MRIVIALMSVLLQMQLLFHLDGIPRKLVNNMRSEEHTSELQSQSNLVCRLLLEKKKNTRDPKNTRLNSSNSQISYAVICLIKKKIKYRMFQDFQNVREFDTCTTAGVQLADDHCMT